MVTYTKYMTPYRNALYKDGAWTAGWVKSMMKGRTRRLRMMELYFFSGLSYSVLMFLFPVLLRILAAFFPRMRGA